MDSAPERHLTLSDMVILVAVASLCIWISRFGLMLLLQELFFGLPDSDTRPPVPWRRWTLLIPRSTQPIASILTLTVLSFSLRRPRPSTRRLTRRAGFSACISAVMAIVVCGILNVATTRQTFVPGYAFQGYCAIALTPHCSEPGLSVAACWLISAWSGRWRAEREWVGRSGMALGVYWLVMIVLGRISLGA